MSRKGEKIGWTWGWLGGFIWLGLLSGIWVFQGNLRQGGFGLLLFILAMGLITGCAPWRHPQTRYWKLMVPIYLVLLTALLYVFRFYQAMGPGGLRWFHLLWITPGLLPFFTAGRRTWNNQHLK